jgi:hypothetical protein
MYFDEAPANWSEPTNVSGCYEHSPDGWISPADASSRHVPPSGIGPILSGPPVVQTPYAYSLRLSDITGTAILDDTDNLYVWDISVSTDNAWVNIKNSIVFEVTEGECYYCRLTAWDDATHSSVLNDMLANDRCRVTALAYSSTGDMDSEDYELYMLVKEPVYNQKLKGNIYYYGDFNMQYRYQSDVHGDYLIFKPRLADIDESVPYGIHDFVITLHYSYT